MDTRVTSYNIYDEEEIENITVELEKDFDLISEILGLEASTDAGVDLENYLFDVEENPEWYPQKFTPLIEEMIHEFLESLNLIDYHFSLHFTEDIMSTIFRVRLLLIEQLDYLYTIDDFKKNGCNVWVISAEANNRLYGSVLAFHKSGSDILIQGISRATIPTLCEIFVPGSLQILPRLNSLLLPTIESIGRSVGASKVVVAPIGNQGKILVKHYGFKLDRKIKYPCKGIRGESMVLDNPDRFLTYSKSLLEQEDE